MISFSIIIPLYNSKSTIRTTLKSVLNQTYKEPFEIIIINDGSQDGCEKIVEDVALNNQTNRKIKLINQNNSGVSSARNTGIKEASGEYIAFLDSDDAWHPQKLELVMEVFCSNNKIEFLGHGFVLENNFNTVFQVAKIKKVPFINLLLKNFAVTPSVVIKRERCKYFNESMSHTEDHDLWLQIALENDVYYLDLPLVTLGRPQLSQGGLSSNRWAMRKGEMRMYTNIVLLDKKLMIFYPFLILFSLSKYARHLLKDFFANK